MDTSIVTIQETRKLFLNLIEGLTIEEINIIPQGFNNNIIWNFGHVIVSQQTLCYRLAGLPLNLDESYILKYAKGTKPETFLDGKELAFLKELSVSMINILVDDLNKNLFSNYKEYQTSFNVKLLNVQDAVKFLTMHEGMHYGYVLALKKLVKK
ncbi:MAG: DinB family protein [Ferruginibacter sp.]|nr:DinB family protein [Ferruginibacter sp.]